MWISVHLKVLLSGPYCVMSKNTTPILQFLNQLLTPWTELIKQWRFTAAFSLWCCLPVPACPGYTHTSTHTHQHPPTQRPPLLDVNYREAAVQTSQLCTVDSVPLWLPRGMCWHPFDNQSLCLTAAFCYIWARKCLTRTATLQQDH